MSPRASLLLLAALACVALAAAHRTRWHELEANNYDFEQYKEGACAPPLRRVQPQRSCQRPPAHPPAILAVAEYLKRYADPREEAMRMTVFNRRLREVATAIASPAAP
jgi:hypothetical protein